MTDTLAAYYKHDVVKEASSSYTSGADPFFDELFQEPEGDIEEPRPILDAANIEGSTQAPGPGYVPEPPWEYRKRMKAEGKGRPARNTANASEDPEFAPEPDMVSPAEVPAEAQSVPPAPIEAQPAAPSSVLTAIAGPSATPPQEPLPGVGTNVKEPAEVPRLNPIPEPDYFGLSKLLPGDYAPQMSYDQIVPFATQRELTEYDDKYNTLRALEMTAAGEDEQAKKYSTMAAASRAAKRVAAGAASSEWRALYNPAMLAESPLFSEYLAEELRAIEDIRQSPDLPKLLATGSTDPHYKELVDTTFGFGAIKALDVATSALPFGDPMASRKLSSGENFVSGAIGATAGYALISATPFGTFSKAELAAAAILGGAENQFVAPKFDELRDKDPENAGYYTAAQIVMSMGLGVGIETPMSGYMRSGTHWLRTSPVAAKYSPILALQKDWMETQMRWVSSGMFTNDRFGIREALVNSLQNKGLTAESQLDLASIAGMQDAHEQLRYGWQRFLGPNGLFMSPQAAKANARAEQTMMSQLYDKTSFDADVTRRVGELRTAVDKFSTHLMKIGPRVANTEATSSIGRMLGFSDDTFKKAVTDYIASDMDIDVELADALYSLSKAPSAAELDTLVKQVATQQIDDLYAETAKTLKYALIARTNVDRHLGPIIDNKAAELSDLAFKTIANREALIQGKAGIPGFDESMVPPELLAIIKNQDKEAGEALMDLERAGSSDAIEQADNLARGKAGITTQNYQSLTEADQIRFASEILDPVSKRPGAKIQELAHQLVQKEVANRQVKAQRVGFANGKLVTDNDIVGPSLAVRNIADLPELLYITKLYENPVTLSRVGDDVLQGTIPTTVQDYKRLVDTVIRRGASTTESVDPLRIGQLLKVDPTVVRQARVYDRSTDLISQLRASGVSEINKIKFEHLPEYDDLTYYTRLVAKDHPANVAGTDDILGNLNKPVGDSEVLSYAREALTSGKPVPNNIRTAMQDLTSRATTGAGPGSVEDFLNTANEATATAYTRIVDMLEASSSYVNTATRARAEAKDALDSAATAGSDELKKVYQEVAADATRKAESAEAKAAALGKSSPSLAKIAARVRKQKGATIEDVEEVLRSERFQNIASQDPSGTYKDLLGKLKSYKEIRDADGLQATGNTQRQAQLSELRKWYKDEQVNNLDRKSVDTIKAQLESRHKNTQAFYNNQIDKMGVSPKNAELLKELIAIESANVKGKNLVGASLQDKRLVDRLSEIDVQGQGSIDSLPYLMDKLFPAKEHGAILNDLLDNSKGFQIANAEFRIEEAIQKLPKEDQAEALNTWTAVKSDLLNNVARNPQGLAIPKPKLEAVKTLEFSAEDAMESVEQFKYTMSQHPEFGDPKELLLLATQKDLDPAKLANLPPDIRDALNGLRGYFSFMAPKIQAYIGPEGKDVDLPALLEHPRVKGLAEADKMIQQFSGEATGTPMAHVAQNMQLGFYDSINKTSTLYGQINTLESARAEQYMALFLDNQLGKFGIKDLESVTQPQLVQVQDYFKDTIKQLSFQGMPADQAKMLVLASDKIGVTFSKTGEAMLDIPPEIRQALGMTDTMASGTQAELKAMLPDIFPDRTPVIDQGSYAQDKIQNGIADALTKIFNISKTDLNLTSLDSVHMPSSGNILQIQPTSQFDFFQMAKTRANRPETKDISNFARTRLSSELGVKFTPKLSNREVKALADYRQTVMSKLIDSVKTLEVSGTTHSLSEESAVGIYTVVARKGALILKAIDDTLADGVVSSDTLQALKRYKVDLSFPVTTISSMQDIIKRQLYHPAFEGSLKTLDRVSAGDLNKTFAGDGVIIKQLGELDKVFSGRSLQKVLNGTLQGYAKRIVKEAKESTNIYARWHMPQTTNTGAAGSTIDSMLSDLNLSSSGAPKTPKPYEPTRQNEAIRALETEVPVEDGL
jgi:hypothetical protein